MKFLRRPVEVDVAFWDGSEGQQEEFEKIFGSPGKRVEQGRLAVSGMVVPHGIYVVRMPDGAVRPYTPDDFHAKYMDLDEAAKAQKEGEAKKHGA